MNERPLNIIIAGGGTGGHIFPAIAIANALKKINEQNQILFVGAYSLSYGVMFLH